MIPQEVVDIARICHEANRAYCITLGDHTQVPWDEAPQWQKDSAIDGVTHIKNNKDARPSASHENWLKMKEAEGWKYGPVKDAEKKEHPCFVPFGDLPKEQQMKDYIFTAIARAMLFHKV